MAEPRMSALEEVSSTSTFDEAVFFLVEESMEDKILPSYKKYVG